MHRALLTVLLASPALAAGEQGTLLLHFLQLQVGQETYSLEAQPDGGLVLSASFDYTERGSHVPLAATLRMKSDFTPVAFEAKGKSYRPFSVDASFAAAADGSTARVTENGVSREVQLSGPYFTISGYAPFSVQMMMLRYWASHGRPARLRQYPAERPGTEAEIVVAGEDSIEAGGRTVRLTRYAIGNIVWGREAIWLDDHQQIAGGVSYAGGLPLEAVREEYRAALPQLIRSANADRLRELAEDRAEIRPLLEGEFAIRGATLIDGTGAAPVPNAVVVVREGKIAAAGPAQRTPIPANIPVIDGAGQTLLPGLWEMHAHFAQVEWGSGCRRDLRS